jgi:hypothetical protein
MSWLFVHHIIVLRTIRLFMIYAAVTKQITNPDFLDDNPSV